MSQVIEDHRGRKQAHDLFPTETPVSDFMASRERSHGLVQAIIESFCDHWAPGGAILGVFDSIIFITAIESRRSMQRFTAEIAWGTEVWIAEDADHLIHFSGEAFLVPHKP